jgi:hypothetical protein
MHPFAKALHEAGASFTSQFCEAIGGPAEWLRARRTEPG